MTSEDLQSIVHRLRAEIDAVESDRPEVRERLDGLLSELDRRLEQPHGDHEDEDFIERVQASIEHFEVEHPRATAILNDLMVKLGSMGI